MHTITPSAVTDVLDYARHSYPLEEDAVICVAFNAQGVPGACARALPTGLGTPVEDLAATMLSTLRQAGMAANEVGSELRLSVAPADVHLFDVDTTERLA